MSTGATTSGGITKWSPEPVDAGAIPSGPESNFRVGNDSLTLNADGSVQSNGVTTVTGGVPRQDGASLVESIRNNMGRAVVDTSSTIRYQGMDIRIDTAVGMGLIRSNGRGGYEDVSGVAPLGAAQEQQTPSDGPQEVERHSPQIEAEWDNSLANVPQSTFDAAASLAAIAVTDTTSESWEKLAYRVAQESGMEVDQAAKLVEDGYAVHEALAAKAVATVGVDANQKAAFYDWMRSSKPKELMAATRDLVNLRRTSQFKALAVQYRSEQGSSQLQTYRDLGFNARVDRGTGEVMVSRGSGREVRARDL